MTADDFLSIDLLSYTSCKEKGYKVENTCHDYLRGITANYKGNSASI